MGLEIETKECDRNILILKWNGDIWKEVDRSLFINELKRFPSHLSQEEWIERFNALEIRVAKALALRLLAKKGRLSRELGEKMSQRGISGGAIDAALQYCRELGFLNDQEHVRAMIEKEQRKGLGKKMILYKLKVIKGVDAEMLQALSHEMSPEEEVAARLVKKLSKSIDLTDRKAKQKLIAKCMRRGFSYSEIADAIEH